MLQSFPTEYEPLFLLVIRYTCVSPTPTHNNNINQIHSLSFYPAKLGTHLATLYEVRASSSGTFDTRISSHKHVAIQP